MSRRQELKDITTGLDRMMALKRAREDRLVFIDTFLDFQRQYLVSGGGGVSFLRPMPETWFILSMVFHHPVVHPSFNGVCPSFNGVFCPSFNGYIIQWCFFIVHWCSFIIQWFFHHHLIVLLLFLLFLFLLLFLLHHLLLLLQPPAAAAGISIKEASRMSKIINARFVAEEHVHSKMGKKQALEAVHETTLLTPAQKLRRRAQNLPHAGLGQVRRNDG